MKKKILIVKEETMFYREKLHDLQDIAESHKIKPIPLDITGRPVFPIALGGLTVHSLGEVNRSGESLMEENDASLSFDALQRSIAVSKSHMVAVIKEEPSDQLLSNSSATLRDLLMS
ncbi:Transforming growth factor beta regulator 1 [Zootermopsis nevadensis]|uniref:Transforming growth factor beta regulator 1 n=1 Tax=Zootermopsis nevadensis TaxID=136037 RepID=A0A067RFB9_ZOONE|nr:Transforming growth factor beta regulator 1 [Zootermopsis nevadensis]